MTIIFNTNGIRFRDYIDIVGISIISIGYQLC